MITDESFPTRMCGLSSWRRLETRVGWPHPFTAKGTEVQRVGRHSQGYTSKGSGWAGLLTPHAARGPRETGQKLSLPGGMVGRGVSQPGRQRPGSVLVHWAKRPPRSPWGPKGLSVRIRESKPETSVFLVLGEAS